MGQEVSLGEIGRRGQEEWFSSPVTQGTGEYYTAYSMLQYYTAYSILEYYATFEAATPESSNWQYKKIFVQ